MKYTVSIDIDSPLDRVIELFDNPDNLKEWMEGLQSFEHLSGTPGEVGARSKLVYKMGKRNVEMIETVTVRKLPKEFSGTYEAEGVFNIVKNKFEKLSESKTRYISEQEFEFKGMMKYVAFLMPWAFKKQSMKYLKAFKSFVESKE
tara:strand:- start:425 stop:862 length:438 start_codon:yes stop_codon:yes gene_type:complete